MDTQTITREQALADPQRVNDLIAQVIGQQDVPAMPDPASDLIPLPGGLYFNGQVYRTAKVKELTGADEEALSKAIAANNGFHFMDTLLTRGVTGIGDGPVSNEMLSAMMLGDRDELLLAIRTATYGEYFELEGWTCPHCGQQSDLKFSLSRDIERIPLEENDLPEPGFEIELRRGAKAIVRFPTGADQKACSDPKWTSVERNSEMLRRCVKTITRTDGNVIHVQAFPGAIAEMNIPDRRRIIDAIGEKAPGPRYNLIEFVHGECQKEVSLALSMLDLFRDLLLGF